MTCRSARGPTYNLRPQELQGCDLQRRQRFHPWYWPHCGVEVWRGGLGGTYRLPALSFAGASLFPPCFRFHTPLIEPDVRICRIRLSEKTHTIAVAIACDAVRNF
jgi:hypothetical protein